MNYKQEILDVRKQRGVSVKRLSEITGIPDSRIYKWESGVGNPKAEDSEKLQEWLNDGKAGNGIKTVDTAKELKNINEWQASVDATLSVLMAEVIPLIAKHTGKSNAAVFSQLKKDIADETANRIMLMSR